MPRRKEFPGTHSRLCDRRSGGIRKGRPFHRRVRRGIGDRDRETPESRDEEGVDVLNPCGTGRRLPVGTGPSGNRRPAISGVI